MATKPQVIRVVRNAENGQFVRPIQAVIHPRTTETEVYRIKKK